MSSLTVVRFQNSGKSVPFGPPDFLILQSIVSVSPCLCEDSSRNLSQNLSCTEFGRGDTFAGYISAVLKTVIYRVSKMIITVVVPF